MKNEMYNESAPNAKVIEARPVGRVETTLENKIELNTINYKIFLGPALKKIKPSYYTCKLTTMTRMVATAKPKLCISAASLPSAFTLWNMVPYGMKKSTNELIIPCMTLKRNSFLLKRTPFCPGS